MEFPHNNSYQSTISMASFEALYGRLCHSPLYWLDTKVLISHDMINETIKQVELIKKIMKEAQDT